VRKRCIYRVVVPLIGKALFMPEEFILKLVRLRWWWDDAEITGFPWWRWKTTEVWSPKPLEVTEEPSAAMGFIKGLKFLLRRSYSSVISSKFVAWGAMSLCCCPLLRPCREICRSEPTINILKENAAICTEQEAIQQPWLVGFF